MTRTQCRWRFGLLLLVVALIAAACGGGDDGGGQTADNEDAETAGPSGSLTVDIGAVTSEEVDPAKFVAADQFNYLPLVYDSLIQVDPETGEPAPGLATDWELSEDGMTLTINLREGVKFHDGTEMTSEDVKFSIERYAGMLGNESIATGAARVAGVISDIEIVDPLTLVIHSETGMPTMVADLTQNAGGAAGLIVPKAYVEEVGDDGFVAAPIGTGPFKFVSQDPGRSLSFEANEDYWGEVPHVASVEMEIVSELSTRLSNLTAGTTDIIAGVEGPAVQQIEGDSNLELVASENTGMPFMQIGGRANPESPFSHVEVRRALSMAVDREGILESLLFGMGEPAALFAWPSNLGWPEGGEDMKVDYDPDAAKELLDDAGFGDGFSFVFYSGTNSRDVAQAIAQNWRDIGLEPELRIVEPGETINEIQNPTGQKSSRVVLIWPGIVYRPDVGSSMLNHLSTQPPFGHPHNDTELEGWLEGATSEPNVDARAEMLSDALVRAYEDAHNIVLWYTDSMFGLGGRVASWTPLPGFQYPLNLQSVQVDG